MMTDIAITGNLPAEPNSFVGRKRDLAELVRILGEVRVLTLCGPGGIGKTRLALRLAMTLAPRYADGAWIVDLADASDPSLLAPLVAAVLGIRQERDQPLADTLIEALRPRSVLLILDTCEHLVGACAALVRQLLASCPDLRVIATSREPLRVRGEVTWRVAPLGLPPMSSVAAEDGYYADPGVDSPASCEAVRLFADRAAAARPGFTLDPANITAAVEVCQTLDGMPLAIELAAARLRALSPEQIATRLADRFALLASGDRAAPRRQQTLRATVDWSYDLLSSAEQLLLRRLSVFAGWNLEMAEQVCTDSQIAAAAVLDLLTALIDKSLVTLDGELNGIARYRLLDTVRKYAADQAVACGEMPELRVAHRDCMLQLQERGVERAFSRDDLPWSERVAVYHRGVVEQANTRAALACCAERGDAELGLRLCVALRPIWLTGGDATDGAAWLDRLLALDREVSTDVRSRALSVRAELAFEQQDYAAAGALARESLEVSRAGPGGAEPGALREIAMVALVSGQVSEALETADAAIAAARAAADEWETGVALIVRGTAMALQGRMDEARREFEVAIEVLGETRGWGRARALFGLGQLARARGESESALRYFQDALVMYRQIDARNDIARCLAAIGRVALSRSDLPLATSSLTESLRCSLAAGQRQAVARGLEAQAALAVASGQLGNAVRLAGTSQVLRTAIGDPPSASARRRLDDMLETARGQLGAATVNALLDEGRAMSAYAAVRLVTAPPEQMTAAGRSQPGTGRPDREPPAAADQSPPDQPMFGTLTEREREIAILVALGLTNAAIGRQLFISPSTAARHVANIFTKLGFSSRAQLAVWVAERLPRSDS
ncbi:MAG TPA: LuxR C-terminal-related transcriptional regulator [Streptosporangiaceae bacterium]|nr:LuxR C-terminal-related transcriptional regulator [Streptosporangiaceae bacterium]